MSDFIKKLQESKNDKPPYFRKLNASIIDNIILVIIRYFLLMLCYFLWFGASLQIFAQEIYHKYTIEGIFRQGTGGDIFQYFLGHPIFLDVIFIILLLIIVGAIYYTYFLTGSTKASLGMRLFKLEIAAKGEEKITTKRIIARYILGLMPWLLYIIVLAMLTTEAYRQALFTMLLVYFWYEPKIIVRSNGSIHDNLCKVFIRTKRSDI